MVLERVVDFCHVFSLYSLSVNWLFCPLAFATMGLCSVTQESVKVSKRSNKSNLKSSSLNPLILLSCLLSVILSEWSEWTPCSPCVPSSSLQHSTFPSGVDGSKMVSVQRRFRGCLDLDSGLPVSGDQEGSQCPGPLVEERPCPDANICRGNGVRLKVRSLLS